MLTSIGTRLISTPQCLPGLGPSARDSRQSHFSVNVLHRAELHIWRKCLAAIAWCSYATLTLTKYVSTIGAGVPLTSPQLYSAGHTDDIRTALLYISSRYPDAPLLGIGFSLGANVLTRYLAQDGDRSRISAACVLGCVRASLLPLRFEANIICAAMGSACKQRTVSS